MHIIVYYFQILRLGPYQLIYNLHDIASILPSKHAFLWSDMLGFTKTFKDLKLAIRAEVQAKITAENWP